MTLLEKYQTDHKKSIDCPSDYWDKRSKSLITWDKPYSSTFGGSLEDGTIEWFKNGKLNACYNCVDRHVEDGSGGNVAIIYEGDEPSNVRKLTFLQLQERVSQYANAMISQGVKKGDIVTIYMPMVPEVAITMLACARIGAVHSVVFAGFSKNAISERIKSSNSKFVFTADYGMRGGKKIPLKTAVDEAIAMDGVSDIVSKVFVLDRFDSYKDGNGWVEGRDIDLEKLADSQRPVCPCVSMDSEDPLFLLYTSGSTGRPKGLVHTTGGYLTYAAASTETVFDLKKGDVYACVADAGWITGHT